MDVDDTTDSQSSASSSTSESYSSESSMDVDDTTDCQSSASSSTSSETSRSSQTSTATDSESSETSRSSQTSTATDSESSTTSTDSESSSVSQKIIFRRDRRYNVTYLPNRFKTRQNPGFATAAHWPRTGKKVTPDKLSKLRIIDKLHRYWQRPGRLSLKKFQRKYRNRHSGHCSYISRLSLRAFRRYQANFKEGSVKYQELKDYCKNTRHKLCRQKKRFYVDPAGPTLGLLPIFEEFLVDYRKVVATEYEWRSVKWFTSEAKRILKNVKLIGLLKPFMGLNEKKFIRKLKCDRSYINKIVVFNI